MSDVTDGGLLDAEAHALEGLYNDAKPDYSPELEWFGMSLDHGTKQQQYVMEAEQYIDRDGITALRDAGYDIQYIEAHNHELDDDVVVAIHLPVCGEVPDVPETDDDTEVATDGGTTQGYPEEQIETGEKILQSPVTDETYRVTKWVEQGDGKFIALEKERLLPYVETRGFRVQAAAIGEERGRCGVSYPGAAGRCANDAEYVTSIKHGGAYEPVPLCGKHAEQYGEEGENA